MKPQSSSANHFAFTGPNQGNKIPNNIPTFISKNVISLMNCTGPAMSSKLTGKVVPFDGKDAVKWLILNSAPCCEFLLDRNDFGFIAIEHSSQTQD